MGKLMKRLVTRGNSRVNDNVKVCCRNKGPNANEPSYAQAEPYKCPGEQSRWGTTGAIQGIVRVAAADNGISAALGSFDTTRNPSTKDMPKTANGLAYTSGL